MNKPEYGDFYKFIASVGVVLISLALVFPWLMLRETFDILHKTSEISEMTQTAQEVITYRQNTALWWVQNVGWFSGGLAFVGLAILLTGVYLWRGKQLLIDQKEHYELEKARRELTPIPPEQIAENKILEVEEQVAAEEVPFEVPVIVGEEAAVLTPSGMKQAVNEVFRIERLFAEKIQSCVGSHVTVLSNQQIRNVQYDIVFRSAEKETRDTIFDIKYSGRRFDVKNIQYTIERNIRALRIYEHFTERRVKGVVIFVTPKAKESAERFSTIIQEAMRMFEMSDVSLSVLHMTPQEVEDMPCSKITGILV